MRKLILLPFVLLVSAAVLLTACGGDSDTDLSTLATQVADQQPQAAVTVVAKGLKFDTKTIVMPANTEVSLTLDNQDSNALHNIGIYVDGEDGREVVFRGELFDGVDEKTETFTSPAAGVYLFRCDAHPEMNGAFITK